jgi:hypothetical protein
MVGDSRKNKTLRNWISIYIYIYIYDFGLDGTGLSQTEGKNGEMLYIDQPARALVCMIIRRSDDFEVNFAWKLWKVYRSKTVP